MIDCILRDSYTRDPGLDTRYCDNLEGSGDKTAHWPNSGESSGLQQAEKKTVWRLFRMRAKDQQEKVQVLVCALVCDSGKGHLACMFAEL